MQTFLNNKYKLELFISEIRSDCYLLTRILCAASRNEETISCDPMEKLLETTNSLSKTSGPLFNRLIMESNEVIPLILKYFNFEQLCIAERINSNFKRYAISELRCLKSINFNFLLTYASDYDQIFDKVYHCCPNLRRAPGFTKFSEQLNPDRQVHIFEVEHKFTHFEISAHCVRNPSSIDYALNLLYNVHNLHELDICLNINAEFATEERLEKIKNLLSSHRMLTRLIIDYSAIIPLVLPSSFVNLSCLSLSLNSRKLYPEECNQLYRLFESCPNLEDLKICSIRADGNLVNNLFKLQCLKKLNISVGYPSEEDSFTFEYDCQTQEEALYFKDLEDLVVYCGNTIRDFKFLTTLLSSSPGLKRCNLLISGNVDHGSYDEILKSIIHPNIMECFQLDGTNVNLYDTFLMKLTNLKHYHIDQSMDIENVRKMARLKNWNFLQFAFHYPDNLNVDKLRIICSASLQCLDLFFAFRKHYPVGVSESIDVICDQCPNLRYLSTTSLPIDRIHRLSSKLRNLEFLEVHYFVDEFDGYTNDDESVNRELIPMIKDLPKLHILLIPAAQYELLLKSSHIRRLCRLGPLRIVQPHSSCSWKEALRAKFHKICSDSCCASFSF